MILKILPILVSWSVFLVVIYTSPYPDSLIQASFLQLISFFMPLFLALTFTLNLIIKNIFVSLSISIGLIFLLILKALDILNLVTLFLTLLSVGLLISYFGKTKRDGLTYPYKMPKLTHLRRKR